jgi:hypothetical protein
MKKQNIFFGIILIVALFSCSAEKTYTYEQLQSFTHPLNPLGTYFWDEFEDLEEKYALSDEESMILGAWNGFEKQSAVKYYFYPNKLFFAYFRGHAYLSSQKKYLGQLFGVWYIENEKLLVRIMGIQTFEEEFCYQAIEPYISEVISISDIDPIGYTRKPMAIIKIPEDIRKQLDPKTMRYKPVRMARSLYSINPLSKENSVSYGYFKHVEEMARRNLTGEQIANSPELVNEFFGDNP